MNKQGLYKHIKNEFELVMNEQMSDSNRNTILCNLMTRLESNFNYIPIMSPVTIPEVKQYFSNHPENLKVKKLYDEICNVRTYFLNIIKRGNTSEVTRWYYPKKKLIF